LGQSSEKKKQEREKKVSAAKSFAMGGRGHFFAKEKDAQRNECCFSIN